MTKAQREEKARNERKLQQMLAAGIKVNALEGEEPKKKPVYDDKKKKAANKKVSFGWNFTFYDDMLWMVLTNYFALL